MNKLSIFLMSIFCLGAMASCEEDWVEATPQSNAQEAIMSAEGLTVSNAMQSEVKLKSYDDAGENIPVLKVDDVKDLPAGSSLKFVMQLSKSNDFATSQDVAMTVADNVATVSPDDWQAAHLKEFGKNPQAKDAYVRFAAYVVKGTSEARLGNNELYYGATSVKVTPYPSDIVVEETYYLLTSPNGTDWTFAAKADVTDGTAESVMMNHTGDPYDNPVFTVKVDVSNAQVDAKGWWWKIVPQSTYETGNWVSAANAAYGVEDNGDTAMSGVLTARTDAADCGAGCLKRSGQWLLTLDFEAKTYAFTSAVDYLYTPGDANGWNQANSQKLTTSNYADYEGYAVLGTGGFKFSNAPDWDHINYGAGATDGTLSTGGGNLSVAATGLYYCKVNTASLTWSAAAITTIGLIGDATPGKWDTSTALTPSADLLKWTGTVALTASGAFKFRANDGWDINLGGSLTNLVAGGDNIATPGAGTYKITLDLSSIPYTATVELQ